jgi:DNA-directed RNA polymerase alpha subunit
MDEQKDAYRRLRAFLSDELRRDDLPAELRTRYEHWCALDTPAVSSDTPLDQLALSPRVRTALRRAGIETAGDLLAMPEADRAALPYVGPQFLADIRVALGEYI